MPSNLFDYLLTYVPPGRTKWETAITGTNKNTPQAEYYLTVPSWCGSTNIQRCVQVGHLYQCRVHPKHYSRERGDCIQCIQQWGRTEREQREQERVKKAEKKAKDTGNAEFLNIRNSKWAEASTKPVKARQTQIPRASVVQKPGKRPIKRNQEESRQQVASEVEQPPEDDHEKGRGKGKTHGLTLFTAKKKWMDAPR